MSIELIIIAAIVMMIFESGFWDEMDSRVNQRFRFGHLPKIFVCQFCQCFWLSLVYLIFQRETLILAVFWALVNANISEVMRPLFKLIKGLISTITEWLMNKLY